MASVQVFVGRWTDWSHGKVFGDSITVNVEDGKYILSGTATFITFVGGFAWTIAAYIAHQFLARRHDTDFLHAQNQSSFRNSQSALSTAWELFCIGLTWSPRTCFCCSQRRDRKSQRVRRRCFPAVLYAMVVWGVFAALGPISSNIAPPAYRSSDICVKQNNCGLWSFDTTSLEGLTAQQIKILNDTLGGRQYARACYSKDFISINPTACSFYTVQSLNYTPMPLESQCPFGSKQSSENLNLTFKNGECDTLYNTGSHLMFTDLLDSHEHLGINAPPQDRIQFQKNTTCSPLSTSNRTSVYYGPFNAVNGSKAYTQYNFGPIEGVSNYTYLFSPSTPQDIVGYQITAIASKAGLNQGWSPISTMIRTDGDTTLYFFAANSVYYVQQVLDPFFLALFSDQVDVPTLAPQQSYFLPSNKVSVMGCVDQYAIVNPNNGKYTRLLSQLDLADAIQTLDLNVAQFVTAQRLIYYFSNSDTYTSVFGFGASAFKASDQVLNFKCLSLPYNQWRTEVEGWFETSLAKIQAYAVEYASNTAVLSNYETISFPGANSSTLTTWQSQCNNQKIRNTGGYQTFSFFGIVLTLVVGTVIVIAATVGLWVLKWIVRKYCLPKSWPAWMYAADGKFQLQRMVLEEAGYGRGNWHDCDHDVPWSSESVVVKHIFWKEKVLRKDVKAEPDKTPLPVANTLLSGGRNDTPMNDAGSLNDGEEVEEQQREAKQDDRPGSEQSITIRNNGTEELENEYPVSQVTNPEPPDPSNS